MRVISNEPLIRRRTKTAQISNLVGLLALGTGLVISLTRPEWAFYTLGLLIVGVIASQYGIVQAFRFARRPRPDQELADALKGLDDRYRLYNFYLPADHVLLTPRALYAVVLKSVAGKVICEGRSCKQERRFSLGRLLRLFSPESLGNPVREAKWEQEALERWVSQNLEGDAPPVEPLVVFLSPRVDLEVRNPDVTMVRAKALKDVLRRSEKRTISAEQYRVLARTLDDVTESTTR
ncbi:MAG: NERD domain-containing protein [Anaerolineae bacterium]|nr:NERD domain-containing protein [Anaerolineae bacterium]